MDNFHRLGARLAAVFHRPELFLEEDGQKLKASRIYTRRRGTALVESDLGILLVSEDGVRFSLPGGAANKSELDIQAAIRELHEETGLCAYSAKYLFSHLGDVRKRGAQYNRNHHQVFLIEAEGVPTPRQEIKVIQFYRPGDEIKISDSTQKILQKYRDYRALQVNGRGEWAGGTG
ncbi:MAG: NUDIX domain-containing protein [Leptolyngbya sp. IPPAS B-1204]|nr:NUDIX domain-containing protein [Elainella sp. C42_A2020_010]RNJ69549.1 MAG: NUDIX domain-containing protein [Leptolyngbya sp. IPPAS B-1204]